MKQRILFGLLFLCHLPTEAQLQKSQALTLTKEQNWVLEKAAVFYKDKQHDPALNAFLQQYKKILAANILCVSATAPITTLELDAARVNTEITILKWEVTNETDEGDYIIERRRDHPFGEFDSVGTVAYRTHQAVLKAYQFIDKNDYPGKTWYRLRKTAGATQVKKIVPVDGYNNLVNVFPNPAPSSQVQVQLLQFKTDDNTGLEVFDASGKLVYAQRKVLQDKSNLLKLPALHLQSGSYYIKVSNKLNTGGVSFLIR